MELNRKKMKYGVIGLILFAGICGFISSLLYLRNPVFLKNYTEINYVNEDTPVGFTLDYIMNSGDTRKIWNVTLDEYPELSCLLSGRPNFSDQYDSFYYPEGIAIGMYKKYAERVNIIDFGEQGRRDVVITKATVHFSDGSSMNIDLGRIEIVENKYQDGGLSTGRSSSSSPGETKMTFEVLNHVSLVSLTNHYAELLGDYLQFELHGEGWNYKVPSLSEGNLVGKRLLKGEDFRIHSFLDVSKSQELKYARIIISPLLTYQNDKKENFQIRIYDVRNYPKFDHWWDVYQYCKSIGEK